MRLTLKRKDASPAQTEASTPTMDDWAEFVRARTGQPKHGVMARVRHALAGALSAAHRFSDRRALDPLRTLGVVAAAVAVAWLSYGKLHGLAERLGFDGAAAGIFPLGFDAAILGFTRAWLDQRLSGEIRDFARKAAKFFIGSSVVGNGVEDACAAFDRWAATGVSAFSAGVGAWLWLLFTVVYAALMPLALGLLLHLVAKIANRNRERREAQAASAMPVRKADGPDAKPAARKKGSQPKPKAEHPKPKRPVTEKVAEPPAARHTDLGPIPTERPAWLTDDMAESASKAVAAWIEHHGDTSVPWLTRWLAAMGIDANTEGVKTARRRALAKQPSPAAASGE